LQGILVPDILPEAKWKTFWANARKGLKKDPLVILPTKRSEPIELLEEEKSFNDAWFRALADQKNMESVLSELEAYLDGRDDSSAAVEGNNREKVVDRLRFVVLGAMGKHDDYLVRAWLIAEQLGIDSEEINLSDFLANVKTPEGLLHTVRSLSANLTKSFLGSLDAADRDACAEVLIQVLPELEYSALNEAIQLLVDQGREDRVASALREVWNQWSAEVDVMFWLSQNSGKISEWNYGNTPDLVSRILKVINRDYTGNRLRVRNQLRDIFRKPAWLKEVLASMDERQRRAFTQGVKDSTAWEQLDKASVLGQIVKIDDSVQDIVSGKAEERGEETPAMQARVSSIRSYKAKEAQLQKLINKDIPENSQDIARAREYGDLRENFEYKAAKDTQRVLMGRRAELENQLRDVHPTDFSEFEQNEAGVATSVEIEYADGQRDTFYIMGEWDSDPSRNIIANASGMALALSGKEPGDTVIVPSEHGEKEATLLTVGPLPSHLLDWARSEPETLSV
jgi:transcription elongation GreA/GreB family factor